jgi:streptogramin lyase
VLLAAALLAAARSVAGDDAPPPLVVPANSIAVVDRDRNAVVAAIPVGRGPQNVVVGAGAVWVANAGDRTLSRIDPKALRVTDTVGLGFEPTDLAADATHVWVAGGFDHVLWRVDRDGQARLKLRFTEHVGPLAEGVERGPAGVALGEDSVWLTHGDEVTELDPGTGGIRWTGTAGGRWHTEIAAGERWVWVGVNARLGARTPTALDRIDLAEDRSVERTELVNDASEILFASERLWIAIHVAGSIWELDPPTGVLQRTIPAGNEPEGLAFADESLWVSNEFDGTVRRIDARSGRTSAVIPIANAYRLEEVAAAEGRLFVAVRGP